VVDLRRVATGAAGALSGLWLRSPAGRSQDLRILAYHEIRDVGGFERQLAHVASTYQPVSSDQVVAALDGHGLPERAIWVTFDDGHPSVVEGGLRAIQEHAIPATMFICPGVVDTTEPYWWQVVEEAAVRQIVYHGETVSARTVAWLKTADEAQRRCVVDEIRTLLEERQGRLFTVDQLSTSHLRAWLDVGNTVGNHTWDHPLLDRCEPAEQERQISLAHEWMTRLTGRPPILFAYPNGNATNEAENVLRDLGYRAAVLFDHHVTRLDDPLRISRIRVTADGNVPRFRSAVSGLHSAIHALRGAERATR
jgi:peptidoglycan/xylan/chitin deacetylase (PgdA/CDA1 family)